MIQRWREWRANRHIRLDMEDGRRNHPSWSENDIRGGVEHRAMRRRRGTGKGYGKRFKMRRKDGTWW